MSTTPRHTKTLSKLHPLALFTHSRLRCASFVFAQGRFVSQLLSYTRSILRISCALWPISTTPRHTKTHSQVHHSHIFTTLASFVFARGRFVSQLLSYTRSIHRILCALRPISTTPRHTKIHSQVHHSYIVGHAAHLLSWHNVGLSRSFCPIHDLFAVFYAHSGQSVLHQGTQRHFPKCTIHTQSATLSVCLAAFVLYMIYSSCLMRSLANEYHTKAHKHFPSARRWIGGPSHPTRMRLCEREQ